MRQVLFMVLACGVLIACGEDLAPGGPQGEGQSTAVEIPVGAGEIARLCGDGSDHFARTALSDREGWYGSHLIALGEKPLCAGPDPAAEVYRLTWLPSFHPTVVVRIEHSLNEYRLTAKTESGAGGYDPGHLTRMIDFTLGAVDQREFTARLRAARFWSLPTVPPPDGTMGVDGAQWVLEGLAHGRYHVVDRWSPRSDGADARYRELAVWLLQRSGLVSPDTIRAY